MLQIRPFSIMRQTGTHITRFKPGIATSLAAIRANIARWTFVPMGWASFVDGLFQEFPPFLQCAGSQIVPRNRECGAEIHFCIGCNGEAILSTGTFNETSLG